MPSIIFPSDHCREIKYYKSHYQYLLDIFKVLGFSITLLDAVPFDSVGFIVTIEGKKVIIDFSDHVNTLPGYDLESNTPYFKYHYTFEKHEKYKNVYPFTPISFYNWQQYYNLSNTIKYNASGLILNNQSPGGNATERRNKVKEILGKFPSSEINIEYYPNKQHKFWSLINSCLVSVCVPGARNNMLDRGQLQYMAFGCCTISPVLKCVLPWYTALEPGVHFVECKPDYSDLCTKINWCKKNTEECIEIGKKAKQLFIETSTPPMLWKWIQECINE